MRVVVALITDDEGKILITRRPFHASVGGLWEFPGGKVEAEESTSDALAREIQEEVGLLVLSSHYLGEIAHTYLDEPLSLLVYRVDAYQGEARCCEAQLDLRWVNVQRLNEFQFPEANRQIIPLLGL